MDPRDRAKHWDKAVTKAGAWNYRQGFEWSLHQGRNRPQERGLVTLHRI